MARGNEYSRQRRTTSCRSLLVLVNGSAMWRAVFVLWFIELSSNEKLRAFGLLLDTGARFRFCSHGHAGGVALNPVGYTVSAPVNFILHAQLLFD